MLCYIYISVSIYFKCSNEFDPSHKNVENTPLIILVFKTFYSVPVLLLKSSRLKDWIQLPPPLQSKDNPGRICTHSE